MTTAEHVLALFLFVGVPVWDVLETRALKTGTNPRRKVLAYQRILVVEWVAAAIAWIALRSEVFLVWPAARQTGLQTIGMSFVLGLVFALMAGSLLQAYFTRRNPKMRLQTLKAFRRMAFILPVSSEERAWFALVSITAGICEEVLYRGFLIRYLSSDPWHLGLWVALAVSCLAFGLAHGYQGLYGIIGTAVLGAVFGTVFVLTGNLWLPIAMHAVIDLRILFLLRPGELEEKMSPAKVAEPMK